MNNTIKALFDQEYICSAEAFGSADITSQEMRAAVKEWFTIFFMREATKEEDPSQRLPYAIVNKLAKAVFSEYDSGISSVDSSQSPSVKAQWLNSARRRIDQRKQELLQWACVGGECFIKPVHKSGDISYHVVRRDRYTVFAREENEITDIGMAAYTASGGRWYTLLERRSVDSKGYLTVRNRLFSSSNPDVLGSEVPLSTLPQYAELTREYTYKQPFGGLGMVYVRLPMVNSVDGSRDGMAVYEPAVQAIHNAYRNERQLSDEFELGRSRILVSSDMLSTAPGTDAPVVKDNVFAALDASAALPIQIFSPQLRDESYERRKQGYLKTCENLIGLKRGILSDVEAAQRTAKEITSSEGDYNLSIIDLQRMYYDALKEALRITDLWGQAWQLCDDSEVDLDSELTVDWGNGVLYDPDREWQETLELVQAGLLKGEIALAKKYDLPYSKPEDLQAIREKYMPELTDLMR